MKAGRELDILVANKVFGWEYDEFLEMFYTKHELGSVPRSSNFRPSTNIADAWLVIGRMKKLGFYSSHTDLTLDSDQEWWSWHFTKGNESWAAQAETAPHAICLAALKALRAEV
ncbi:BC1872 family protein [Aneurinibacillus migulanus]|uniref:BC1872 family protein n=1 Tax=Aneurinibacillus migulanus TaxID=47500 RepID=UPI00209DB532|nr:hypothetical protein [Aneurinibacillus migulanus]MCP1355051.1 hypothetical protein [Aneurinibacillus migulanus]